MKIQKTFFLNSLVLKTIITTVACAGLFALTSCSSTDTSSPTPSATVNPPTKPVTPPVIDPVPSIHTDKAADEISVMSFNVENMFDDVHNEGIDDYPYLPLSMKNDPVVQAGCNKITNPFYRKDCFTKNWDDDIVEFKISQVAKVISFVDNGVGPDNLLMAEVENVNILTMLVQKKLSNLGYKTISILKGPDTRGINTAFISKFPLVGEPILHIISFPTKMLILLC